MNKTASVKSVGVREFREQLATLLLSDEPIAITKHGLTVGYYLPTHHPVSEAEGQALQAAAERLHALLEAKGLDPEVLIREAKALRKEAKKAPHA